MTEPNPGYNKETPASWQENYRSMITSAEEAIARIRPGQRVFIGTGCAQPQALVKALVNRSAELEDIEIIHLLSLAEPSYGHKELAKHFHIHSFFIGSNINETQELGDYTPIFLSDIPRLFRSGELPVDVALIQVTPPTQERR